MLMVFFFLGYVFVAVAFLLGALLVSEIFVSVIFFFGALFVLLGILIQSRMLQEIQSTIQGIVPICANCKKIRREDSDPNSPSSWLQIESYISERTGTAFSHGICPECVKLLYPDLVNGAEEC